MKKTTAFLLGATALAVSASDVSASGLYHGFSGAKCPATIPATLWNQTSNNSGQAVVSQNFTSGSASAYDTQSADDFIVPGGICWIVREVDVTGQYFSGARASSENVFFYSDAGGLPGTLVDQCLNLIGKPVGAGSFNIILPRGCRAKLNVARGPATTYWVSVQINIAFTGEPLGWGWDVQTTQEFNPAAWQNPGDGFGTGCTTWADQFTCTGLDAPTTPTGGGGDVFTLKGKET